MIDTQTQLAILEPLLRRKVVTMDEADREKCCGLNRDDDGFCVHRPGHPIFMSVDTDNTSAAPTWCGRPMSSRPCRALGHIGGDQ